jgi:hypothetical protein
VLQTDEIVEVDAVPVPSPVPQPGYALIRSIAPATQAMVVAAGGFVAGATVIGLATRRRGKVARARGKGGAGARRTRKRGGAGELVRIVGTRSLLVDVHLLDGGR